MGQFAQFNYGESLVAEIFKQLISSGKLWAYDCQNVLQQTTITEFSGKPIHLDVVFKEETYKVNGMHKLDMGIEFAESIHPIEVKLGETLKCKSFPSTFENFLDDKVILNENNDSISGNMIKLLEDRVVTEPVVTPLKFKAEKNPKIIDRNWSIVIREKAFNNKNRNIQRFPNLKYVFVLDQLWQSLTDSQKEEITKNLAIDFTEQLKKLK